jgi:hypothetical protein
VTIPETLATLSTQDEYKKNKKQSKNPNHPQTNHEKTTLRKKLKILATRTPQKTV